MDGQKKRKLWQRECKPTDEYHISRTYELRTSSLLFCQKPFTFYRHFDGIVEFTTAMAIETNSNSTAKQTLGAMLFGTVISFM